MGSTPTLRNEDYAAAVITMSDHPSCLEGVGHGCFTSGFSVVWHICCWKREAKLQELQELSIESTPKAGAWGNQNGEHVLSCQIQPPITAYNQIPYSIWQILLVQALFFSLPTNLFEIVLEPPCYDSQKTLLISTHSQFPPIRSCIIRSNNSHFLPVNLYVN